ncbi:MAG: DUF445 domain-containing protein [Zetaproteobacteria bacterium]|nr:DUF445 domain-containing protein [Zetaproteobacteria bacterium]
MQKEAQALEGLPMSQYSLSKANLTNGACLLLIGVSFVVPSPLLRQLVFDMGFFAISGSITNSIAIHMLFEKVPGLYGSGIIELRFQEFKKSIEKLILGQFFSASQIQKWAQRQGHEGLNWSRLVKPEVLVEQFDYEQLFDKLIQVVTSSPLGGMLALMGGAEALQSLKEPAVHKMREALVDFARSDRLQKKIDQALADSLDYQELEEQLRLIVCSRLEELTPGMVKELVQEMIREHLGWLVVWGGVFGGVIGALAFFTKNIAS